MEIKLKHLTLTNFKGIHDFSADFDDITTISGANATGKTTLFDAFTWVLFGKDSGDKKEFNIKTLDIDGNPKHHLDHEVTAIISVDGMETTFRRVYKEKWVKRRGEETTEFAGHTTDFFVNGVPLNQKEYQDKVDSIIDENVFKAITSTAYFNNLSWEKRRELLFSIAGGISDEQIFEENKALKPLLDKLTGKDMEGYRKELAAERKRLKDILQELPPRINEANRSIITDVDFAAIETKLTEVEKQISEVDKQLSDASEKYEQVNRENQEKLNVIYKYRQEIEVITHEINSANEQEKRKAASKITEIEELISETERSVTRLRNEKTGIENQLKGINSQIEYLREQWAEENAKQLTFNEDEFSCPACNRPFETGDIEAKKAEITTSFNEKKSKSLADISAHGKDLRDKQIKMEVEITQLDEKINLKVDFLNKKNAEHMDAETNSKVPAIKNPEDDPTIKELEEKITGLKSQIKEVEKADNTDLINRKAQLKVQGDEYRRKLGAKETNEKQKTRIQELKDQEKKFASELAGLEKYADMIDQFTKAKIDAIEEKVNSMFGYVKFRMFKEQINGGYTETCDAMVDGVPFADLNTASQINAGVDIINTLSRYYNVRAMIWVDHAESITKIIDSDSQMIRLVVDENCKKLKINNYALQKTEM